MCGLLEITVWSPKAVEKIEKVFGGAAEKMEEIGRIIYDSGGDKQWNSQYKYYILCEL